MDKRNENENRETGNRKQKAESREQKLKLISRHANINFKFAKPTSHKQKPSSGQDERKDHDQVDEVATLRFPRFLTVCATLQRTA